MSAANGNNSTPHSSNAGSGWGQRLSSTAVRRGRRPNAEKFFAGDGGGLGLLARAAAGETTAAEENDDEEDQKTFVGSEEDGALGEVEEDPLDQGPADCIACDLIFPTKRSSIFTSFSVCRVELRLKMSKIDKKYILKKWYKIKKKVNKTKKKESMENKRIYSSGR